MKRLLSQLSGHERLAALRHTRAGLSSGSWTAGGHTASYAHAFVLYMLPVAEKSLCKQAAAGASVLPMPSTASAIAAQAVESSSNVRVYACCAWAIRICVSVQQDVATLQAKI